VLRIEETDVGYKGVTVMPPAIVAAGDPTSRTWEAANLEVGPGSLRTGIWIGEPGVINVPFYPVDEIFTVLSGRVAMTSPEGIRIEFGPGESGLVRKGWVGVWETMETTRKCFVIHNA